MKNTILKTAILVLISTAFVSCEKEALQPEPVITEPVTIYDCEASQDLYDSLEFQHQIDVVEFQELASVVDQNIADAVAAGQSDNWIYTNIQAPYLEQLDELMASQEVLQELLSEMISNGCF